MPTAEGRELIPVSSQAHKHLKTVVAAMKEQGIPTNGTLIASELILSIPIPQPTPAVEVKRRTRKAEQAARVPAL